MRHRFHSICPYFAMFPETFVSKHLVWSERGEHVFDPFSGRGTTVFESLLRGRPAAGCDTNPVAVCVSNAKANPPSRKEALARLKEIESTHAVVESPVFEDRFFSLCFHRETLGQILHLRRALLWRDRPADCFLAALVLGSLHGESHRSRRYFSNRMPRTISTKPDYSVRWWTAHRSTPPHRNAYRILREMIDYRFASDPASLRGCVIEGDARRAGQFFPHLRENVSLVITSPPYLDTTNFEEDQWLRIWFLGGPSRPKRSGRGDDRHRSDHKYWKFLEEAWTGISPLLAERAHLIIRIGGKKLDPSTIHDRLLRGLEGGLGRAVQLLEERVTEIAGSQLRAFRPGASGTKEELDFHFAV